MLIFSIQSRRDIAGLRRSSRSTESNQQTDDENDKSFVVIAGDIHDKQLAQEGSVDVTRMRSAVSSSGESAGSWYYQHSRVLPPFTRYLVNPAFTIWSQRVGAMRRMRRRLWWRYVGESTGVGLQDLAPACASPELCNPAGVGFTNGGGAYNRIDIRRNVLRHGYSS